MLVLRKCQQCERIIRKYVCPTSPPGAGKYCSRQCHYKGMSKTVRTADDPTWRSWSSMKSRCLDRNSDNFKNYGAKGVTVCPRWVTSFQAFLQDMGPRPGLEYSLDRYPDPGGNYEPGNCRWATRKQQRDNRRPGASARRLLTHLGETKSVRQWAKDVGISEGTISYRLSVGWEVSAALMTPVCQGRSRAGKVSAESRKRGAVS